MTDEAIRQLAAIRASLDTSTEWGGTSEGEDRSRALPGATEGDLSVRPGAVSVPLADSSSVAA